MPFRLGPWEIGFVLVIVLIVFGVGKLPQIGGAIGRSVRQFRQATHGESEAATPGGSEEQTAGKPIGAENHS